MRRILLVLCILLLAGRLVLVFRLNINWDEFLFLSHVYEHTRGALASAFQTAYVHAFTWLPAVPGYEIPEILTARSIVLLLACITAVLVLRIAGMFFSKTSVLFAVLCFFAYSDLLLHGNSFRADGLAAPLLMCALYLLLRADGLFPVALAAVPSAVALLVTVKSVFWMPTLWLAAGFGRGEGRLGHGPGRTFVFAVVTALLTLVGFLLHRGAVTGEALAGTVNRAGAAASTVFTAGIFPRWSHFMFSVLANPFTWIFIGAGIVTVARGSPRRRRTRLVLLSLLLPLASVVVYRNAFPYYYGFVLPPAFVLAAAGFDAVWKKVGRAAAVVGTGAVFVTGAVFILGNLADGIERQRRVLDAVHRLFPVPVPYVDGYSMVSSFPKVGFFMSSWGWQVYRERDRPVFPSLIEDHQPLFLLGNSPSLWVEANSGEGGGSALRTEDVETLRDRFVRYWGPIFVVGSEIRLAPTGGWMVDVPAAGLYRFEAPETEGSATLEGHQIRPGDEVQMEKGSRRLTGLTAGASARVVLSMTGPPPSDPPPPHYLFRGFLFFPPDLSNPESLEAHELGRRPDPTDETAAAAKAPGRK